MSKKVKQLFGEFQPKHYVLQLEPDRDSMKFAGSVIISGKKVGKPSRRLTLHQKDLKVTKAYVIHHDKKGDHELTIDRVNVHRKYDEVRLHADRMLYPGSYTLRLEFSGVITKQMNGLYPCFFTHKNKNKTLLATQFESHHAREVFPCIDEPEAKSTFSLTITAPLEDTVASNTPIKSRTEKGSRAVIEFEQTPHMSTYLLAFVMGDMQYIEAKTRQNVVVRAYATPANVAYTDFALDVAVKCLEFYHDYFAIPYPLAKCDMIALPDFASGAMENWGCITYREQALLVDPKNSTLANKQWVAMVVAHELAHQWFGNLVTMRWWTDLWLNEGFASWIEFLAIDQIFPEWEMWTQFVVDEQQQALKLDALEHTHPVEVPVHHPDEIRSIFDAISYSKGASIIHMLHGYLGPDQFRDGLRHYLAKHQYGSTDTIDLWHSLEEVSGRPVANFMHAWTSQPGFPLIRANVTDEKITVHQERFYMSPDRHAKNSERWPAALLANTREAPEQLTKEAVSFHLPDHQKFKLNSGQSGFYRTIYNASHLERLGELVRQGQLDPLERLGLLSDVLEAAKAGYTDTVDALHFLENFRAETNYAVWDVVATGLGNIRMIMNDEALRKAMKPYVRTLIRSELARLGWSQKPNESHFDRLLRPIILGMAASADDAKTVKHCRELFDKAHVSEDLAPDLRVGSSVKQVKRGVDIDPDMRGVVFGTIARHGNKADFEKLLVMHNSSNLSEERTTLAAALTGFRQPELINRALNMIDSEDVRLQDVAYWIAYSFLNRHARVSSWKWLKEHWKWLHQNLGNDLSFYRTPIYVARAYSDISFKKEFQAFFQPRLSPALDRSYRQGLEMLTWQAAWKERDAAKILHFFKVTGSDD